MKVRVGSGVTELLRTRGGRLFVWPGRRQCCQGATYLTTSERPAPGRTFSPVVGVEGFQLWFDPGHLEAPKELHLEVKGWRSKRVEAYWDGCVFVV